MNLFLVVLIVLWVADAATTVIALHKGGLESNPLFSYILNDVGEYGFFAVKFLLCVVVVMCMWYVQNIYFNVFAVVLYLFIVGNNIYQIRKLIRATV